LSKQIWLGPILGSNRERIIERCTEILAAGSPDSFLYLTASRPLLDLVVDRLLDGIRVRGVWGTLPVFLFRGFVRHLLATAVELETGSPLPTRVAIDREEAPLKRSLVAQLIRHQLDEGRLRAIGPLATREGCVNSVASLIGEIQRAARNPAEFAEIIDSRFRDSTSVLPAAVEDADLPAATRQIDFDRDIAVIYSDYAAALERFRLTESDADALRALGVLRGDAADISVLVPWLPDVKLLVVDGFFDFTPVQGEILRLLIPRIPDVVINLNRDEHNPEIFRAFDQTLEQLNAMAEFEIIQSVDASGAVGALADLRNTLFNTSASIGQADSTTHAEAGDEPTRDHIESNVRIFECSDRETEIRSIAKEIKRLVSTRGYTLSEIALVVRQRASYADIINRIFDDEMIPCYLDRRIDLAAVPAVRAVLKLFQLLRERDQEEHKLPRAGDLADLIKSEYFRLGFDELQSLGERFSREYAAQIDARARAFAIRWDADELENVIAFVGAELRADNWLRRARQLTFTVPAESDELTNPGDEAEGEPESYSPIEENVDTEADRRDERSVFAPPGSQAKRRVALEVSPASIAWTALIVEKLVHLIQSIPDRGQPTALRIELMNLLGRFELASRIKPPASVFDGSGAESAAAHDRHTMDLRGLEGIRRAFNGAIRSIEIGRSFADSSHTTTHIFLSVLLDEVTRCINSQTLEVSGSARDGLRVLEATDIRGLRFRAVFVAGLIESGFPLRTSGDWIYPHDEREQLKRYGLTLEDISPNTLLKEEHYFYQAACRATERLYVSRPMVLEDGSETVPSYYIEELRHVVAPVAPAIEVLRRDYDGAALFNSSTQAELAVSLVRQQERHLHRANRENLLPRGAIDQMIHEARQREYLTAHALERIDIERQRSGRYFGVFDGIVERGDLMPILRQMFGPVFSASELSLYGKCPFKFFAQRVMKLAPRGEAAMDLSALDAGTLLHEILRRFFERHRGERLESRDLEILRDELRGVADDVFDEHERRVPPLNPQIWAIDREIRKVVLDQVLNFEIQNQKKTEDADVRPAFFELAFGMNAENADPASIDGYVALTRGQTEESDEAVLIRGQIDRVDIAADGTVVAYDYKLSQGATLRDMKEGRDLQLHLYLAALEQLFLPGRQVAGGGYYVLRGAKRGRNQGLYRSTLGRYTGAPANSAGQLTESDWLEARAQMGRRIWEFIDGMRAAHFEVNPSAPEQTCRFCDYAAVCRYEKFRIRRKTG
jgi:ATP-dependent helicase/nuclease subunit B